MKAFTFIIGLSVQQAWCQRNFTAFWLKEMWSPYSPDVNLMDFGICSMLEQKACIVSQPSVEVKKKIQGIKFESETVRVTCAQLVNQSLRRAIREKGKYTE